MGNEHADAVRYSSKGNTRWIVLRGPMGRAVDRLIVRFTGFSVITWQYSKAGGNPYQPTLLVTTIGRRTGKLHSRALPYYRDGGRVVIVGSNGGGPKDPDWVWNIRENRSAWVCIRRRRVPVRAHEAEGTERERIFDLITSGRDSLTRYQERAATFGRRVPLVVLESLDGRPLTG